VLCFLLVMANISISVLRGRVHSLSESYDLEEDASHSTALVHRLFNRLRVIQLVINLLLVPATLIALFVAVERLGFSNVEFSVGNRNESGSYPYTWASIASFFVMALLLVLAIRLTWIPIDLCCCVKQPVAPDESDAIADFNDELNRPQQRSVPSDFDPDDDSSSSAVQDKREFVVKPGFARNQFTVSSTERLLHSPYAYGALILDEEALPQGPSNALPVGVL